MQVIQFDALFKGAFDTFKVFDDLTLDKISPDIHKAPKTIWQILNHLINWQRHQLQLLADATNITEINEQATWIAGEQPKSQEDLNNAIFIFHNQLKQVEEEISKIDINATGVQQKLHLVQDVSVHLSFHVGEVILMRRMAGTYPLPHQMKDFLS